MNTAILDFLLAHAKKNPVSFHMPGHKGSYIFRSLGFEGFLSDIPDLDITELTGADNLFQAEGIIKQVQDDYARLYGVDRSYLLINGSSGGIIASIMASVQKGRKIIMARNCHKSVFSALMMADVRPVYAYPDTLSGYGISGAVDPEEIERLCKSNDDAEAVILPSPNYYGICSDIRAIADTAHRYGKILIVDQAHGAHLKFFSKFAIGDMPIPAEESGADIIIDSTHKTLASLTQSAVLHLNSDRVDPVILADKLQCIESTSPSYILMASLDVNRQIIEKHGPELFAAWASDIAYFYSQAEEIPGLSLMTGVTGLDRTKISLDMSAAGLSGAKLEKLLLEDDIFIEMVTGNIAMCVTGIGNRRADYDRLLGSLKRISILQGCGMPPAGHSACDAHRRSNVDNVSAVDFEALLKKPHQLYDVPKSERKIPLADAAGLICASSVIPYPPGIPLICPGEVIEQAAIDYVLSLRRRGEKVIGVSDAGDIMVGI